jgi:hypothetical protein
MLGADDAAYFPTAVSYISKMFIQLITRPDLIKLFVIVTDKEANKLELVPGKPFR